MTQFTTGISPLTELPPWASSDEETCSGSETLVTSSNLPLSISTSALTLCGLPHELSTIALTAYASPGTLLKLSTVCKRLKPLSRLVIEDHPSPTLRYTISLSMLGLSDANALDLRFHRPRALRILTGLCGPSTSSGRVKQLALLTLANEYAQSISCSKEATDEARRHGVRLLESAYGCAVARGDDEAVVSGAVGAARAVAFAYETGGMGVKACFKEHKGWLSRAAGLGCLESACDLALCYEMGDASRDGVGADEGMAFETYLKAAEEAIRRGEECDEAFSSVGEYYEEGKAGIAQDHWKAVEWYRRGDSGECRRGRARLADVDRIMGTAIIRID